MLEYDIYIKERWKNYYQMFELSPEDKEGEEDA